MALPFVYASNLISTAIKLDEEASKHLISVLRKKAGEEIYLTDGKGKKALASIIDDNRKHCLVQISAVETLSRPNTVSVGVSLIKNLTRLEWFMEKASELGVAQIIPLICERTEKQNFRAERIRHILISAMLQSQQCWVPDLSEPRRLTDVLKNTEYKNRYFAHCLPQEKKPIKDANPANSIILIGPEGDFTKSEIELALLAGYEAISLGSTRLRTETAAMAAAVMLCLG